jgi:hypothetical protein
MLHRSLRLNAVAVGVLLVGVAFDLQAPNRHQNANQAHKENWVSSF